MSPIETVAPRKHCQKCEAAGYDPLESCCAFCDEFLQNRHEHDHFPIPKRHGGTEVVPVCLRCHDMKDRIPIYEWNVGDLWRAITESPPEVRIFAAWMIARHYDLKARS